MLAILASLLIVQSSKAESFNFVSPQPKIELIQPGQALPPELANYSNMCVTREITIYNRFNEFPIPKLEKNQACVHTSKSFNFAYIRTCMPTVYGGCQAVSWFTIGFPGDSMFYRIEEMGGGPLDTCWQTSPLTDEIYYTCNGVFFGAKNVFNNMTKTESNGETYYIFNPSSYTHIKDDAGRYLTNRGAAVSSNNKWAILALEEVGLVRVDLSDFSVQLITKDISPSGIGKDPMYHMAITNDGRTAVVAGINTGAKIYAIDDKCGESSQVVKGAWRDRYVVTSPCSSVDLIPLLENITQSQSSIYVSLNYAHFSSDQGQVTALYYSRINDGSGSTQGKWVTISAHDYNTSFEYIALGDSYASGEGDLGKKADGTTYYFDHTNRDGGCHLSGRSYPYILRDYYQISPSSMASIACSGAKLMPDVSYSLDRYYGQHNELAGLDILTKQQKTTNSLINFVPGIVPQLEFVKKYQPKVVTISGGGNDVGFADILSYCAMPDMALGNYTCDIAFSDSEITHMILNNINSLYYNYLDALKKLHTYSPSTKVIIIGYPLFIKDTSIGLCKLDGAYLDNREIQGINKLVVAMNDMLRSVATKSGAAYVNIERSLIGGRICEGGTYMTGLNDLPLERVISKDQQLFHPNAEGHYKIAQTIINEGGLKTPLTNVVDSSFNASNDERVSHQQLIGNNGLAYHTNPIVMISTSEGTFDSVSKVSISLQSKDRKTSIVNASQDGSLSTSFNVSKLPYGQYILQLKGLKDRKSTSLYQFISIFHSPEDADGNGVPNSQDDCIFGRPLKKLQGVENRCHAKNRLERHNSSQH